MSCVTSSIGTFLSQFFSEVVADREEEGFGVPFRFVEVGLAGGVDGPQILPVALGTVGASPAEIVDGVSDVLTGGNVFHGILSFFP